MSIDTFSSPSPWTCPYCTVINSKSQTRCEMCLQPRPGHRKRPNETSQWWPWPKKKPRQWTCDKCSYSNNPSDNKCASCGKAKKGLLSFLSGLFSKNTTNSSAPLSISTMETSEGSSSMPSDWICSQCTYCNDSSAIECKQCRNCKVWDDSMNDHEGSYEMLRSQDDRSHDDDVIIMSSHNGKQDDGTPVDKEDVMIIDDDDVIITNDDVMVTNENNWKCSNCTLINKIANTNCSACGSTNREIGPVMKTGDKTSNFNPATQWACPHCSMYNSINDTYCSACMNKQSVKKKSPITMFDPLTQWQCQDCSLYNKNDNINCMACCRRRRDDAGKKHDVSIAPINQWQCLHCSLFNNNDCNTCSACGGIHLPKSSMATKEITMLSSLESSTRRTRLYSSNHTAYISISVRDKRDLINNDAMNHYKRILEFCKQVSERELLQ